MILREYLKTIDKNEVGVLLAKKYNIEDDGKCEFQSYFNLRIEEIILKEIVSKESGMLILCILSEDDMWDEKEDLLEDKYYYHVLGFKIDEIESNYPDFNNLSGYAIGFSPMEEWLGWEIPEAYIGNNIIATEILREMFFMGMDDDSRKEYEEDIVSTLKERLESAEEGNYISSEEVFKKIYEELGIEEPVITEEEYLENIKNMEKINCEYKKNIQKKLYGFYQSNLMEDK